MSATFRAGGLASGLDTNSIVDSLVALQRQPIAKLETQQKVVDVKISALAQLTTKLKAFETAAKELASHGARGFAVAASPASVGVATTSAASPGQYSLEVGSLAQAAKARSTAYGSGVLVQGTTLHLSADGTNFDIAIPSGATLEAAAAVINAGDAPVTASVIDDGVNRRLVLTRTTPGHVIGSAAETALTVTETADGGAGQVLGLATAVTANNAQVTVDGLAIERRSNTLADVIPGVTLTLQRLTTAPESLVIADDPSSAKTALQKVVDAYNAVIGAVQGELNLGSDTDRTKTLGGEPAIRALQSRMQTLLTREVGSGDVRTLADLGVRTARDGSLTIDGTTFDQAMAREPGSLDVLFDAGLADLSSTVVGAFTNTVDGSLSVRTKGLSAEKERLSDRIDVLEARAERYRDLLITRFTAMEKLVSSAKAIGTFLSSQDANNSKG